MAGLKKGPFVPLFIKESAMLNIDSSCDRGVYERSHSEARRVRMDHWTGERSLLANRTFVLELALAEEGYEDSLAALAAMLVVRPSVDASASPTASWKAPITSAGLLGGSLDFDHPALRTDEGFLFFCFACRDSTDQ